LAHAKVATPTDSGLTTAEKVCALTSRTCHWPLGDPARLDFRFCGSPAVGGSYCDHHRARAFQPKGASSPHRIAQKASQCR
jgi:GcrA cell cycle regulator